MIVKSNVLMENRAWSESFRLRADRFIHVCMARTPKGFHFRKQELNIVVVDEFARALDAVSWHRVVGCPQVHSVQLHVPRGHEKSRDSPLHANRSGDSASGTFRTRVLSADFWS